MEYILEIDTLMKVWKTTYVQINAKSRKEALERALDKDYDDIVCLEYDADSEEIVPPENAESIIIKDDTTGDLLYNNSPINTATIDL